MENFSSRLTCVTSLRSIAPTACTGTCSEASSPKRLVSPGPMDWKRSDWKEINKKLHYSKLQNGKHLQKVARIGWKFLFFLCYFWYVPYSWHRFTKKKQITTFQFIYITNFCTSNNNSKNGVLMTRRHCRDLPQLLLVFKANFWPLNQFDILFYKFWILNVSQWHNIKIDNCSNFLSLYFKCKWKTPDFFGISTQTSVLASESRKKF